MPRWTRRALIFAAAFFAFNMLLNLSRADGLTGPSLAATAISTVLFTILFVLATLLIDRFRNRGR